MSEVGFYHLTRTSAEAALPRLLGRTLAAGQRAVVLCSPARMAALDDALWAVAEPDWLPHGTARTGEADLQPIWLTDVPEGPDWPPNGARYLFLLDGLAANPTAFDRVFDLFDGADDGTVQAARQRWTTAKAAGHAVTYWQQGAGGWEKKA